MAPQTVMLPAVAAMAVRSMTSAVASLTSPSPSRIITSRGGSPSFLPMDVAATASGGLITAPSATAAAKPMSGSTHQISHPVAKAEAITSRTDRALIVSRSRRKPVMGTLTAAE